MNLLFVATIFRCGEKVFPIVDELCKKHTVDVFLFSQMSTETHWGGNRDLRNGLIKRWKRVCRNVIVGPSYRSTTDNWKNPKKLCRAFDPKDYSLAIIDDNMAKPKWGTRAVYQWLNKHKVTVVACPHGNREFGGYRVVQKIGQAFDYSFVFGPREKSKLIALDPKGKKRAHRLIAAGIPANDVLKDHPQSKEYVLIVPNYTRQKDTGNSTYPVFNRRAFVASGVDGLSKALGLPIVITIKSRISRVQECIAKLSKELRGFDNVRIIVDPKNPAALMANAECVISAPSTFAFKAIQLGKPTVLLEGHNMLGNFAGFPGLVSCDEVSIRRSLDEQRNGGRCVKFLDDTLSGGSDFTSTDLYLSAIEQILGGGPCEF